MISLSSSAIASANTINTDAIWVLLLEVKFGEDTIRICRNNENIEWNGHSWDAFPFDITDNKSDNKGTLSNITINVDNTTRELEYYLENSNGGAGCEVVLYVVRVGETTEADLEEHFSVKSTSVNDKQVSFVLGSAYGTRQRRPFRRYMKNSCPFKFKGCECGYNGTETSCNHTLTDCRERNNSTRFGGFAGIPQGGSYV